MCFFYLGLDEKSETSKKVVRDKVTEYLNRAEQLKDYLKKSKDERKPIGATTGDGSGEETDADSKKFKSAMEGLFFILLNVNLRQIHLGQ